MSFCKMPRVQMINIIGKTPKKWIDRKRSNILHICTNGSEQYKLIAALTMSATGDVSMVTSTNK